MGKKKSDRIKARIPRGLRDVFHADIAARRKMIRAIRQVYELHGFEPLETPGIEYVDVLGKFLPDVDRPAGGIFAFQDDDEQWIALRYDLTAALSRVMAQNSQQLPRPFRRYQIGPVWRQEKPGPGRFREFYQCDFDSVGTSSPAADAEVCSVLASCFNALGFSKDDFVIKVNNRKVLNGILNRVKLPAENTPEGATVRWAVLRGIDKLDRLGQKGVRELLGKGRMDDSGDYTKGAGLTDDQVDVVLQFVNAGADNREDVCKKLKDLVGEDETGKEGVLELETMDGLLTSMGLSARQVAFDPSIVRGLGYYTGPVFEGMFTFDVKDEKGRVKPFGSVAGGGRYDNLVERFTGQKVPATGASIGIDRLLEAMKVMGTLGEKELPGPVVVTVMDKSRLTDYQQMVAELRNAGIAAEMFLGTGGFGKQVKYADKRKSPVAVIAGGDEFDQGEVSLKDLKLGMELAKTIEDRDEWSKGQPAQVKVPRSNLVAEVQKIMDRSKK